MVSSYFMMFPKRFVLTMFLAFNVQAIIRHRTKTFSWTSPAPLQSRLRKRFSKGSSAGRLILLWITQTQVRPVVLSTFIETHEVRRNKLHVQTTASLYRISRRHPKSLRNLPQFSVYGNLVWGPVIGHTRMRVHAVRPSSLRRYLRRVRKTCNPASGYIVGHWRRLIFRTTSPYRVTVHYSGEGILQRLHTFPYTL